MQARTVGVISCANEETGSLQASSQATFLGTSGAYPSTPLCCWIHPRTNVGVQWYLAFASGSFIDGFRRAFRNSKSHEPPPKGTVPPGCQAAWMQEVEDLPPARPPFQPGKVQGSLRRRPREQALLGPLAMACRAGPALTRSSAWHSALLPFGRLACGVFSWLIQRLKSLG